MRGEEALELCSALCAALGQPLPGPEEASKLEAALQEAWQRARAAWPRVAVDAPALASHLAPRLPRELPPRAALAQMRVEDLYLAQGCIQQLSAALEALEQGFLSKLDPLILRVASAGALDETKQRLRYELLVRSSPGGPVGLEGYSGRGPLLNWLSIAAAREAGRLRQAPAAQSDDALLALPGLDDPELDLLRRRYRGAFNESFRAAFRALAARDQNLLRFHTLEGLNIDQLGDFYQVHRATAARWLARARATLLKDCRKRFMLQTGVSRSEADSLVRLLRSNLELSLNRALLTEP